MDSMYVEPPSLDEASQLLQESVSEPVDGAEAFRRIQSMLDGVDKNEEFSSLMGDDPETSRDHHSFLSFAHSPGVQASPATFVSFGTGGTPFLRGLANNSNFSDEFMSPSSRLGVQDSSGAPNYEPAFGDNSEDFGGPSSPPPPPSMLSLRQIEPMPLSISLQDWKESLFPEDVKFHKALRQMLDQLGVNAGTGLKKSVEGRHALALLDSLSKICNEQREEIMHQCLGKSSHLVERERDYAERLKLERNTWSLLSSLLRVERDDLDAAELASKQMEGSGNLPEVPGSEQNAWLDRSIRAVVADLYTEDKCFRRRRCVLKWLESLGYEDERVEEAADLEGEEDFVWGDTLRQLELGKGPEGIRHMDPDANFQDVEGGGTSLLALTPLDEDAEEEILTGVWTLLRSGKLEEAIAFCQRRGHHWRAASLRGAQLYTEDEEDANTPYLGGGNPRRGLWLDNCASLCASLNQGAKVRPLRPVEHLELAIAAVLSGDLATLMASPLCSSWEDQAWAMFRCKHDLMIDKTIFAHQALQLKQSRFYPGLDTEKHNKAHLKRTQQTEKLNEAMIFTNLKSPQASTAIRAAATGCFYRQCQEAAITGLGALGNYVQGTLHPLLWTENTQDAGSGIVEQGPALKRFAAHLVIYARVAMPAWSPEPQEALEAKKRFQQDFQEKAHLAPFPEAEALDIIEKYTDHLARIGQSRLTALYLSFFPVERRIEVFARILKEVTEKQERRECLDEALLHFPENIVEILCKVVSDARRFETEADVKLDALRWLCFESEHAPLARKHGLALARQFVLNSIKADGGIAVGLQLPKLDDAERAIDSLKGLEKFRGEFPIRTGSFLWEHQHWELFFEAHHAYTAWSTTLASAQAQGSGVTLPQGSAGGDAQVQIQYSHQISDHTSLLAKQNADVLSSVEEAVASLKSILLCQGGWLRCCTEEEGHEGAQRQEELNQIRSNCLPQILFMLHRVLFSTANWALSFNTEEDYSTAANWYKQSMDLSNIVASEEFKLFETVQGENLTHFLSLVYNSSMALLKVKGKIC